MGLPNGSVTQVCYVVKSLDEAMALWSKGLRAGPFFRMNNLVFDEINYRGRPDHGSISAALGFLDSTLIELVQPTDERPSIFREVFDQKGEGIHHFYPQMRQLSAAEYDSEYARYQALGFQAVLTKKTFGMRNAFFDARSEFGYFLELSEFNEAAMRILERMYGAHLTWTGSDPVRDLAQVM